MNRGIKGFVLALIGSLWACGALAQVNSVQDGDWDDPNTWDCACIPDNTLGQEVIVAHNVTVTNDITLNIVRVATGGLVTINSSVLVALDEDFANIPLQVDAGGQVIVNGTLDASLLIISPILVDGSITSTGSIIIPDPSVCFFNSGSLYTHSHTTQGDIPIANWDVASTVLVNGMSGTTPLPPNNLNQSFGNFTWNCPGQALNTSFHFGGQLTDIQNDLSFISSNSRPIRFDNGGTGFTLDVGRDFTNQACPLIMAASTSGNTIVNVTRDFTQSGGSFTFRATNNTDVTLRVGRNFSKTSGAFSGGSGTGISTLSFNGGADQTYSLAGTNPAVLNYEITNSSRVDLGTSFLTGTGALTVLSGSTIRVGSTDLNGAIQTGTTAGNVRVSGTRTYSSGSTIEYNGAGNQVIGNGHPSSAGVNTTINNGNSNTVSLAVNTDIGGNLTLSTGSLSVGNFSLTLNGNLTPNGRTISTTSSSNLVINGVGSLGVFPFPTGAASLNNLTVNRNAGSVTLGNNLTVAGILSLTDGDLIFNNQQLTLNGTLVVSSGFLSSNNASTLVIGGSGAFGTISFSGSGNTLNTLTLQRTSGTVDLNSNLTISSALNLTNGTLNNLSGLTMANGATIFRTSNGSFSGGSARPVVSAGTYNVTYNTSLSVSTGNELPTSVTENILGNFTVNGPVSLSQNVTVNGTVLLQSSTFSCGSSTLKMRGASWSKAGGAFDPGTGQVTFDGSTTISTTSGNPRFGNVRVETARTLTFPTGTVEVSGNVTFIAGSTINSSGGTILLNGTGAQAIGAGGATLANVSVSKSSGSVSLSNALNMTGDLSISTSTVFASTGNLTLLSTSDGTSGNASIGDLSAGGSVTGDVTVQRFMSGEGRIWRYLSSPIQNASVASWKDDFPITGTFTDPSTAAEWPAVSPAVLSSGLSFYRYDETVAGALDLGWENYPTSGLASANPLDVGRGYSAFVRISASPTVVDVTGPINSGDQALPVSFTGSAPSADNGWNLVGNPYPATIDWDDPSWTKTNISSSIQIRDNASGIFQTWNGSVGSMGSGRIATGQAFWVKATSGSPSLIVRESAKNTLTGTFFKENNSVPNAFEVTLTKDALKDYTYIWFNDEATEEVDDQFDAIKFNNDIFDLSTLTLEGKKLAINTLPKGPCARQIKLDVSTKSSSFNISGTYTLNFSQLGEIDADIQFVLVDRFLGTSHPVSEGFEYTFAIDKNTPASFGSSRLELQLSEVATDLQLDALGSQICSDGVATVTLPMTQEGIGYRVVQNGQVLSNVLVGNGGELTFDLVTELLSSGENSVKVEANNGCSVQELLTSPVVTKELIEQVSEIEEAAICKGGEVSLKAFGASSNSVYRWYSSETDGELVHESHESEFITPSLEKTRTYFVSIANALGCESPRVAVTAEVVNFDDVIITEDSGDLLSSFENNNQWYFNGNLIEGATGQKITPTESGTYRVEATFGSCTTSAERVFAVTGLDDEKEFDGLFAVFPNPVKNKLGIQTKLKETLTPRLVDLQGRVLGEILLQSGDGIQFGELDTRELAAGVYILQVSGPDGKLLNKRIVKH